MGHDIRAVIAAPAIIARVASAAGCPPPKPLPSGLAIAALGDAQIDTLTQLRPGERLAGFGFLSERLKSAFETFSEGGALAYVETNYFGGAGSQAAAVFTQGRMSMALATPVSRAPVGPDDPINTALRALGVKAAPGMDEFDTQGLGRFRSLEALGVEYPDD